MGNLKKWLVSVGFGSSMALSHLSSAASRAPLQVDFYPMVHAVEGFDLPDSINSEYFLSQLGSMIYLRDNHVQNVFVEGNFQTINSKDYLAQPNDLVQIQFNSLTELFKNLPSNSDNLTDLQKIAIREHELGVMVLFKMGKIENILPTQNERQFYKNLELDNKTAAKAVAIHTGRLQASDDAEQAWADEVYKFITTDREVAALDQIKKFASEHPEVTRVSLLYGMSHQFLNHQKDYPELKLRRVNTRKYRPTLLNLVSGAYLNEPLYENYVYNASTGRMDFLPGANF